MADQPRYEVPRVTDCFACGQQNPIGLRLQFRDEGERVASELVVRPEWQGYQNMLHGGVLSAALDDAMVVAAWRLGGPNVTARMQVEFKLPIPVGATVRIEGEVVKFRRRLAECAARALLADGVLAAVARGTFLYVDSVRLPMLDDG